MTDSVFVHIEGLQELGEKLRTLASNVSLKIGKQAVNVGAQVIKEQVIVNAPRYPTAHKLEGVIVPPGNLKNNVVVKQIKTPLVAEYIVTVRGKRKDAYAARYARLVEFGTINFEANPFFRKAWESRKRDAADAIKEKLIAGIENVT